MESIGSADVVSHLPELLERVARGEEFLITEQGKAVARLLAAPEPLARPDVRKVIEELTAFRKGNRLGEGLTIREMIEDGRRY